ncbi:MAG: cobalamin-dependent protein [Phycisphaerae bacterium]|nr:cobalamin-dependent protein [Phycisphaerae bacterium]
MTRPIRVLVSKIGLDGHDRGAKLIVRNLRDAGMEVIYTGLWQTPASTVFAATQEDVDIIGVSLLSAAHMTIMPEVQRLCAQTGIGDIPLVVGGIIPEDDEKTLRARGIAGIFTPGTPTAKIVDEIRALAAKRRSEQAKTNGTPDLSTDVGLARAITRIAEGDTTLLSQLQKPQSPVALIGVTGAPGVGKSTFIGRLARQLRERKRRVAVIAVDPSSPITGGSVLGDRLRMMSKEPDHDLFVRSLASCGQAGGLAPHCADIAQLFAAASYEVVLVETVGAGQNDVQVRELAPDVLLLLMPGAGDSVQFTKAGVLEIATALVLNKVDLEGADTTVRQLRDALDDDRPIWEVSSLRTEGFEPICDWVESKL